VHESGVLQTDIETIVEHFPRFLGKMEGAKLSSSAGPIAKECRVRQNGENNVWTHHPSEKGLKETASMEKVVPNVHVLQAEFV
jgi:hypothetical protein